MSNSSFWKHTTCATRVFFRSLFSWNFHEQLSSNFHRFFILCIYFEIRQVRTFWAVTIVSGAFNSAVSTLDLFARCRFRPPPSSDSKYPMLQGVLGHLLSIKIKTTQRCFHIHLLKIERGKFSFVQLFCCDEYSYYFNHTSPTSFSSNLTKMDIHIIHVGVRPMGQDWMG